MRHWTLQLSQCSFFPGKAECLRSLQLSGAQGNTTTCPHVGNAKLSASRMAVVPARRPHSAPQSAGASPATSAPDISDSPPAALWDRAVGSRCGISRCQWAWNSFPGRPRTSRSSLLSVTGATHSRSHMPPWAVRLVRPTPSPQPCSSQWGPKPTARPCTLVGTRFSQHLSAPLSIRQQKSVLSPYISRAFVPRCSVTPSAGSHPSQGHRLACCKQRLLHEAFVVSSETSGISSVI